MRFSKKEEVKNEVEADRKFELTDKKPEHYFYEMYKSQVYTQTSTWGDIYRLFKYFRRF